MTSSAAYETGMRITFDAQTKRVNVAFRGRLITLPGEYASERAGITAGEDYCRGRGWIEKAIPDTGRSLLRPRTVHF